MKVIVLGAGLIGAPMAIDFSKDEKYKETVADYNDDALNKVNILNALSICCRD